MVDNMAKFVLLLSCLALPAAYSLRLPHVGSLDIGEAVNIDKLGKPGIQIFKEKSRSSPEVLKHYKVDMRYKSIKTLKDKKDLLDVGGALSVRIKAATADVAVNAAGKYLSDKETSSTKIEFMFVIDIILRTETLTSESKVDMGGFTNARNSKTHYVRSVTHGERLVGNVVYSGLTEKEKEDIDVSASLDLSLSGGTFDISVAGQFKQLKEKLKNQDDAELKYSDTSSSTSTNLTLDNIDVLIKQFMEGKHVGTPLYMDVLPLHTLNGQISKPEAFKQAHQDLALFKFSEELKDLEDTVDGAVQFADEIGQSNEPLLIRVNQLKKKSEDVKKEYKRGLDVYKTSSLADFLTAAAEARELYVAKSPMAGVTGSFMAGLKDLRREFEGSEITTDTCYTYNYLTRFTRKLELQTEKIPYASRDAQRAFEQTLEGIRESREGADEVGSLDDILKIMETDAQNVCNIAYFANTVKTGKGPAGLHRTVLFALNAQMPPLYGGMEITVPGTYIHFDHTTTVNNAGDEGDEGLMGSICSADYCQEYEDKCTSARSVTLNTMDIFIKTPNSQPIMRITNQPYSEGSTTIASTSVVYIKP